MTDKPPAYRTKSWPDFLQVVDHLRHQDGLTVRELSARVGGNRQHLGRQLLGQIIPLTPFAWQIARALGYDIALIPRKPEEQP